MDYDKTLYAVQKKRSNPSVCYAFLYIIRQKFNNTPHYTIISRKSCYLERIYLSVSSIIYREVVDLVGKQHATEKHDGRS